MPPWLARIVAALAVALLLAGCAAPQPPPPAPIDTSPFLTRGGDVQGPPGWIDYCRRAVIERDPACPS